MPERPVPHPLAFRAVLASLGLIQTMNGVWALFFPQSFYDDFPAGRGGWVSALPAYNEHLLTDVGALFLATGLLMLAAAVLLGRTLVWIALVSWLLWAVPHAVWHLGELEPYSTTDAVGNVVTLALTVLAPLVLVALLARAGRPAAAGARPGDGDARIRRVERSRNPIVRYAFRQSRRMTGRVAAPVAVFAHHPPLLAGWGLLELATERSRRVPVRIKDLGAMKAAALAGCEWCLDFGSQELRDHGISDDDMRALPHYRESDRFSEVEKLVLDYAAGISRTPVEVSDELFAQLREHFDEAQLVELTSAIALENYRARCYWALGIRGEGYSEGAYCMRPEAPLAQVGAGVS